MNYIATLLPVFVLVALTLGLLVWQARARIAVLRSGQVKISQIALGEGAWPVQAAQINRAYQNQLELPVLFYVLVALTLVTRQENALFVAMEWLFVASRLAHACVHVTSNHVVRRFQVFTAGFCVLAAMWAVFAARVALS